MAINSLSTGWRPGVATSSTRPTAPYEGQVIYETDTDLSYVWGGAAWQQVSGGTAVGNSGLVYITQAATTTASSSLSISGCFSSTYLNYRVVGNITGSAIANKFYYAYRLSTTDARTANYQWVNNAIYMSGGSAGTSTIGGQNATEAGIGYKGTSAGYGTGFVIDFYSPFSTGQYKSATHQASAAAASIDVTQGGSSYSVTTSYDGFTLISESGTMSISAKVYGYRQS